MLHLLHPTLRAAAFLTRLPPFAPAFRGGPHPLGGDAAAFPAVGLLAAAGPAAVLALAPALGLGPLAGAAIAVLLLVALTGALHEDGLGDTADGLFGHRGRDEALRIMKDSRVGTYGALALGGSLLLRVALLAEVAAGSALTGVAALAAAAALSRGAMAWLWSALPTADAGGLADRVGRPDGRTGRRGAAIGVLILAAAAFAGSSSPGAALAATIAALALSAAVLAWLRRVLLRRLGGQTGDTLGAAQQLVEIAVLLAFALG